MSLNNIRIAKSGMTGTIYLARFGKDPALALEKRPLTDEEIAFLKQALEEK